MEVQSEKLLQDLVDHEKNLVARVEQAREEAAEIVRRAEAEAARINRDAETEAERLAQERAAATRDEAEALRQEILEAAQQEVAEMKRRMAGNIDRAVKIVMEGVVP